MGLGGGMDEGIGVGGGEGLVWGRGVGVITKSRKRNRIWNGNRRVMEDGGI